MERNLPGVFNAAGLMVPDPSISAAPIPFIDDVAGIGGAEYMMPGGRKAGGRVERRTDRAGTHPRP